MGRNSPTFFNVCQKGSSFILAISEITYQPWPGGSVGWSIIPYTKRLWVPSPVRAHTWVVSSTLSQNACRRRPISVSLSLSLSVPASLSKN